MKRNKRSDATIDITQIVAEAILSEGGACKALHDGVMFAEIPDPTGQDEPIPVLLAIHVKSSAETAYEGFMRTKGFVPAIFKGTLRASYIYDGLDLPPGLH